MKQDQDVSKEEAEKHLDPQLANNLIFWQNRAKNAEMFIRMEDLWALQYRWKYQALRRVGFGRIASFIMLLKVMK